MPTPKRKYSTEKAVDAVVDLATGKGRRYIAAAHGIAEGDAPLLKRIANTSMQEFRAKVADRLQGLTNDLITELASKKDKIPPGSLPVSIGILIDKINALEGLPGAISAHVSLTVPLNGITREEMAAALAGSAPIPGVRAREGRLSVEPTAVEGAEE